MLKHRGAGSAVPSRIDPRAGHERPLRLLSYNIQAGITTRQYRQYITASWKHVLPFSDRMENLDRIASMLGQFDIIGLQEVDAGSLRSGFVNQTDYLATKSRFPYWYDKTNRDLGIMAQHSIGLLSRYRPQRYVEHNLPGFIPGRGMLAVEYGSGPDPLVLLIVHFALGKRARMRQIDYVAEVLQDRRHAVLMGDFNCTSQSPEIARLMARADLGEPLPDLHTYPSWRPERNIDHILVSRALTVRHAEVLKYPFSDHLPIVTEVILPDDLLLEH